MSGAKDCKSCRSRKMLQNAPILAIIAFDTEENEPLKFWDDSFSYSVPSLICISSRPPRRPPRRRGRPQRRLGCAEEALLHRFSEILERNKVGFDEIASQKMLRYACQDYCILEFKRMCSERRRHPGKPARRRPQRRRFADFPIEAARKPHLAANSVSGS